MLPRHTGAPHHFSHLVCPTVRQEVSSKGAEGKAIAKAPLVEVLRAFIRAAEEVRKLQPKMRSENTLRNLLVDFFVNKKDSALQAFFAVLQGKGEGVDLLVAGEGSSSLGNTAIMDKSSAPTRRRAALSHVTRSTPPPLTRVAPSTLLWVP